MKRQIEIGDKVICGASGVIGIVEKFYYPTACKEQTMIICSDGISTMLFALTTS